MFAAQVSVSCFCNSVYRALARIASNVPAAWRRRGFHNCHRKGIKFPFTHNCFLELHPRFRDHEVAPKVNRSLEAVQFMPIRTTTFQFRTTYSAWLLPICQSNKSYFFFKKTPSNAPINIPKQIP